MRREAGGQTENADRPEPVSAHDDALLALAERVEAQRLALERTRIELEDTSRRLEELLASRTWRWLCSAGGTLLRIARFVKNGSMRAPEPSAAPASDGYREWIEEFERRDDALDRLKLRSLPHQPLISILMPVYRPEPAGLERAIASVAAQSYSNWELSIADDGSDSTEIAGILRRCAEQDSRIRLAPAAPHGGISAALNRALAQSAGAYVAMLDHDDELAPDALLHVGEAINLHPDAGFLYSDEDIIDERGNRRDPFFKPEWSPDLLLSENYICHLLIARRDLVDAAGGFRSGFDGAQDYDLVLRLSGQCEEIVHIPHVLYHWRAAETSTVSDWRNKPHADEAAQRAVQEHVQQCEPAAVVEPGVRRGRWRIRYPIPEGSHVAILIPSAGNLDLLRTCIASLRASSYPDCEIVVIDNSRGSAIGQFTRRLRSEGFRTRYIDFRGRPFNWAAMNNAAARETDAPYLLFLNDDTEAVAPGWLEALLELAVRPEVGAVGAKLLYPGGGIQHAGIIMGLHGTCGHAFRRLDANRRHYFDFPDVIRNVSAVTGACLMVRAGVFRELGGFDEANFPVDYNDVDFCMRLGRAGYRVLYTPHAVLTHHEAASKLARSTVASFAEADIIRARWRDVIAADPYYSPHLTRATETYAIKRVL